MRLNPCAPVAWNREQIAVSASMHPALSPTHTVCDVWEKNRGFREKS